MREKLLTFTAWGSYTKSNKSFGGSSEVDPPVLIPNTAVKHLSADDTASVRVWENKSPPGGFFYAHGFSDLKIARDPIVIETGGLYSPAKAPSKYGYSANPWHSSGYVISRYLRPLIGQ
jgi:hypothetical protein